MNSQTYWFITGISNRGRLAAASRRCWGFFDSFQEAERAVLENDADIYECEYEHMVIEGYRMGLMVIGKDQHWYKYDPTTEKFNSIAPPDWAVNVVNWGIG
jgi:hypothetical protein